MAYTKATLINSFLLLLLLHCAVCGLRECDDNSLFITAVILRTIALYVWCHWVTILIHVVNLATF